MSPEEQHNKPDAPAEKAPALTNAPPGAAPDAPSTQRAPGAAPNSPPVAASNAPPTQRAPALTNADKLRFGALMALLLLLGLIGVALVNYLGGINDTDNLLRTLTERIREAGILGVLVCLGFQFIQIVIAFIPGEVVQAAIGLVYGTILGGIITSVGALISSIFIFYVVRKLGAPFVQAMLGSKESRRMDAIQRFLSNNKRLNATVFILYLIPGMPKDLFTYLVPLTPMRPAEFFVLSTIARSPAIFATTFVMDALTRGNYLACIIVAVLFGGLGAVGIIFNLQIMRLVDRIIAKLHRHED